MEAPSSSPAAWIEGEAFDAFKESGFDVTSYVSTALKGSSKSKTASQEVKSLSEGLQQLEKNLRREISDKFEDLVQQVQCVETTGQIIVGVKDDVKAIQDVTRSLRQNIQDPQRELRSLSSKLRSVHTTLRLVKYAGQYLKHVIKLREQMRVIGVKSNEGTELSDDMLTELAKAAKTLTEISAAESEEPRLKDVAAIAALKPWLAQNLKTVVSFAKGALRMGLDSLSYGEIGLAFQVYFNLGELKRVVAEYMASQGAQISRALEEALSRDAIAKMSASLDDGRKDAAVLRTFAGFVEVAFDRLKATWHIQRVLANKFDPASNASYLDEVVSGAKDHGQSLTESLWHTMCGALSSKLGSAFYKSIAVKRALVLYYPDLANVLQGFAYRVQGEMSASGVRPALPNGQAAIQAALKSIDLYQGAFLTASLNRMVDSVNILFNAGSRSLPTSSDMKRSITCFFDEIKKCSACGSLLMGPAVGNVVKGVRLMVDKAEAFMASGAEVRNVSGACTPLQMKNITLCCRIQEVYVTLSFLLVKLDKGAGEPLAAALEALKQVSLDAISPIFRSMLEMLEESIAGIHGENFAKRADGSSDLSVYLSDLLMRIPHCRSEYLSKFKVESTSKSTANLVNSMIEKLGAKVLDSFVRHAALVSPLAPNGRRCLADDMKQIEDAIGSHLCPLECVGASRDAFRGLAWLLTTDALDAASLEAAPQLKALPVESLTHHLFSRGPVGMQAPPAFFGLSPAKYVVWMDQHTTDEIVEGAKDCAIAANGKGEGEGEREGAGEACALILETIRAYEGRGS